MTEQMFDQEGEPRATARATDPETSHEAAASVKGLRASQEAVRATLQALSTATLEELVRGYQKFRDEGMPLPPQSESGIRTRLSELRKRGLVVDSGRRRITRSGRKAIVWRLVAWFEQ